MTLADNAAARADQAGSSASRCSYSFMADPQPAEFTTIASSLASSNVSISRLANATASARRPSCSDSAPQQPWLAGMTTSQPSLASTRAVALFTCGKKTCCTQPVSIPTTARRSPLAATNSGIRPRGCRLPGGATRSAAAISGAIRSVNRPRSSRSAPVRWAARSGPISALSLAGYGNVAKMAARSARCLADRGGSDLTGSVVDARPSEGSAVGGAAVGGSVAQALAASMSRSYLTPDGHAGTQAMQPRHRSRCRAAAGLASAPSSNCPIR